MIVDAEVARLPRVLMEWIGRAAAARNLMKHVRGEADRANRTARSRSRA